MPRKETKAAETPEEKPEEKAAETPEEKADAEEKSEAQPESEMTAAELTRYVNDEVAPLAEKLGLKVTISRADGPAPDAKRWPSVRYMKGSAKTGRTFASQEEVDAAGPGWTDKITTA